MDTVKKVVAGMFLLIVTFLLLKDAGSTSKVINAVGGGVQQLTTSLQGGA